MNAPTNDFGVLALVVLVLPGVVWVFDRTAVRGPRVNDADVADCVLQALVTSVALDGAYFLALASPPSTGSTPRQTATPPASARQPRPSSSSASRSRNAVIGGRRAGPSDGSVPRSTGWPHGS